MVCESTDTTFYSQFSASILNGGMVVRLTCFSPQIEQVIRDCMVMFKLRVPTLFAAVVAHGP